MTTAADDSAVEDAFEAILAGRPVPERAAGLAAFTGAVRASATTPGRPNAALAELLATGLLTDQSSPSVRTARSAGSAPERRSRVRTRRRTAMILPALIAKFLSAGAVAQAATGATVAVVAFTGVGAVGALPDPVQDTFATVVAEITPLEAPTSEEETTEEVVTEEETLAEEVEGTEETTEVPEDAAALEAAALEAEVKAWALAGPTDGESISEWVEKGNSAEMKNWLRANGMTFGNVVSAHASGKGFSEAELSILGGKSEEPAEGATEPETVVDTEVTETDTTEETEVAATEDRGSRGNGKATGGNGNGRGNGKN
jgi:hypothetical protein